MRPVEIESDTLAWATYSTDLSVLKLGFHDGAVYAYFDVPPSIYSKLLAADSKGRYFNLHIRNNFRAQLVPFTTVR